jgi:hypothetical protein
MTFNSKITCTHKTYQRGNQSKFGRRNESNSGTGHLYTGEWVAWWGAVKVGMTGWGSAGAWERLKGAEKGMRSDRTTVQVRAEELVLVSASAMATVLGAKTAGTRAQEWEVVLARLSVLALVPKWVAMLQLASWWGCS